MDMDQAPLKFALLDAQIEAMSDNGVRFTY